MKKDIDGGLQNAVDILAQQISLDEQITQLGGDPAKVRAATAGATATVRPLQAPFPYQTQQLVLGIAAGVLIYISLMLNGQWSRRAWWRRSPAVSWNCCWPPSGPGS